MAFVNPLSDDICQDVEEEIEMFCVSKQQLETNSNQQQLTTAKSKKILHFTPLLLKDIATVSEINDKAQANVYKALNGTIFLHSCTIYARVVGRLRVTKCFNRYMIDDGTAVMELNIFIKHKELLSVERMKNELSSLATHLGGQKEKELCERLTAILEKTEQQIDSSNINIGSRLLIYGRPDVFRGEVKVLGFSVFLDNGINRNMEIAFKDYLINCYSTKYPARKSEMQS